MSKELKCPICIDSQIIEKAPFIPYLTNKTFSCSKCKSKLKDESDANIFAISFILFITYATSTLLIIAYNGFLPLPPFIFILLFVTISFCLIIVKVDKLTIHRTLICHRLSNSIFFIALFAVCLLISRYFDGDNLYLKTFSAFTLFIPLFIKKLVYDYELYLSKYVDKSYFKESAIFFILVSTTLISPLIIFRNVSPPHRYATCTCHKFNVCYTPIYSKNKSQLSEKSILNNCAIETTYNFRLDGKPIDAKRKYPSDNIRIAFYNDDLKFFLTNDGTLLNNNAQASNTDFAMIDLLNNIKKNKKDELIQKNLLDAVNQDIKMLKLRRMPKDKCLDNGGCWDSIENICRRDEIRAQEYCHEEKK